MTPDVLVTCELVDLIRSEHTRFWTRQAKSIHSSPRVAKVHCSATDTFRNGSITLTRLFSLQQDGICSVASLVVLKINPERGKDSSLLLRISTSSCQVDLSTSSTPAKQEQ